MQSFSVAILQPTVRTVPRSANNQANIDATTISIGISILILPLMLILSRFAYNRYRTIIMRRQIELLERLWHLKPYRKAS